MPVARRLLDNQGEATVSDLRDESDQLVIDFLWDNELLATDHRVHSCFGQVFRRLGAVNVGTRPAPASNRAAKGIRQVVWAWPSPYRDEV